MTKRKWGVLLLVAGIPLALPASGAPLKLAPKPGRAGTFPQTIALPALSGGLDGIAAGRALARLKPNDVLQTRGAQDADIYRRISPSVVLVITPEVLGTGSFVTKEGLILTCYHVVAGHTRVGVVLKPAVEGANPDPNKVLAADVIKIDLRTDLALLKLVPGKGPLPPPVAMGDLSKVAVGDDVEAIGHPTGETWSFTKGYVSQIRRDFEWKGEDGRAHHASVVQTQTPINPGNSGGPLLDTAGHLIGINAFKSEGEGLNFAISVKDATAFIASQKKAPIASARACAPKILFEGRAEDDKGSLRMIDTNCNGKVNIIFFLDDDTAQPELGLIDATESGRAQGLLVSEHRNGKWDYSYWDSDGDGYPDTLGNHRKGEILPSSYSPLKEKKKNLQELPLME